MCQVKNSVGKSVRLVVLAGKIRFSCEKNRRGKRSPYRGNRFGLERERLGRHFCASEDACAPVSL